MKSFFAVTFVLIYIAVVIVAEIHGNPEAPTAETYRYNKIKREITKDTLPHLVKIGYKSQYGWIWGCTGALINHKKVVTSTSCSIAFNSNLKIVQVQNEDYEVRNIVTKDEVAVLLLEKHVDRVGSQVRISPHISNIRTAVAAGWAGLLFDNLLHATINKEMSQTKVTLYEVSKDTIKVRPINGSVCVVDRGGPLQIPSKEIDYSYQIIGILRDWKNCGENGSFGSYIVLGSYKTWIETL